MGSYLTLSTPLSKIWFLKLLKLLFVVRTTSEGITWNNVYLFLILGVGTYLKSKNPNVKVVLADPEVTSHKVIFHLVPLLA